MSTGLTKDDVPFAVIVKPAARTPTDYAALRKEVIATAHASIKAKIDAVLTDTQYRHLIQLTALENEHVDSFLKIHRESIGIFGGRDYKYEVTIKP